MRHSRFSVFEIILTLVVIGAVSAGASSAVAQIWLANERDEARIKAALSQVVTIAEHWRFVYRGAKFLTPAGTDMTQMTAKLKFAPEEMYSSRAGWCAAENPSSGCVFESPWTGGAVSVTSASETGAIRITYWALSPSDCFALADAVMEMPTPRIVAIKGHQTAVPRLDGDQPITAKDMNARCNVAADGNSVSVFVSMQTARRDRTSKRGEGPPH